MWRFKVCPSILEIVLYRSDGIADHPKILHYPGKPTLIKLTPLSTIQDRSLGDSQKGEPMRL
jgi:hypothetical protein